MAVSYTHLFDIADVSGSIRMFSDVMKKLGIKLDGDEDVYKRQDQWLCVLFG